VLDRFGAETTLLFFMTAHWRKPIDFSDETMAQAEAQARTLSNALQEVPDVAGEPARSELSEVLDDDFNTPAALALFHEWRARGDLASLRWGLDVFGLGGLAAAPEVAPPEIVALAQSRAAARARQDWPEADRLRAAIEDAGWEVRDISEPPAFRLLPRA
jgi:cysteinyl-tRNA synthetase